MRRLLCLLLLLWAAPARASELTFENLWPYAGVDIGGIGVGMWAADGTPEILYETLLTPIAPGESRSFALSDTMAYGFAFQWLDVGGPCPQNCGWGTSVTDTRTNTWIGGDVLTVNALWPTYDGGMAPVVRMTFTADAREAGAGMVPLSSVPEPGTLALMLAGGAVMALRKRRKAAL